MGPSAAHAGRPAETQRLGQDSSSTAPATGSADGDRVELSSTLGRLAQVISTHATKRTERVQALAGEYQAGRLRPNSETTSRAMVAEALAAPG
jgi:anti-sigma28 factor (negative regulator of flagellin synthesis)